MPRGGRETSTKPPESTRGSARAHAETLPAPLPLEPLRPRPLLLTVMAVIFALWMGFLVALYFKTIHPRRSAAPEGSSLAPAAPSTTYSSSRAAV